ncbi:ATP-binding protein [Nitrospinota bacterium]
MTGVPNACVQVHFVHSPRLPLGPSGRTSQKTTKAVHFYTAEAGVPDRQGGTFLHRRLQAQEQNIAIILIDTEGEYCALHEPTEKEEMLQALRWRDMKPAGVENTHVYHLVGRETANPKHPRVADFSLRFCELSPHAVKEILDLNEAQEQRFIKAYDITKQAMEQLKIWPSTPEERAQFLELDELEEGYPKMTLGHLYDVVKQIAAIVGNDPDPSLEVREFSNKRDVLKRIINGASVPGNKYSWFVLIGKLSKIHRLKIFDSKKAKPFDYSQLLQAGRVSILDLSDTDSPEIRNLVIAELLRGVQLQQEQYYKKAVQKNLQPTPALVFIEEAHEFLSAQRIRKMEVLFQQVARIARRGRKRWLGLVFITQLPQHLPDEVMGLINNWVLHKISDAGVVSRLKRSIGGINEALWRSLPSLAPGQAIVSFTTHARPLQISVDPTPCRLLMVE